MGSAHIMDTQRIYYNEIITEMDAVGLGKHGFHDIVGILNDLEGVHGIDTGADERMVELVYDPENLGGKGIGMIFNGNLHAILVDIRDAGLEFLVAVCHLTHHCRVHAGTV